MRLTRRDFLVGFVVNLAKKKSRRGRSKIFGESARR